MPARYTPQQLMVYCQQGQQWACAELGAMPDAGPTLSTQGAPAVPNVSRAGYQKYAEGGQVASLVPPLPEEMLPREEDMEVMPEETGGALDVVAESLTPEELGVLNEHMDMDPELEMVIEKIASMVLESGEVEGPGGETEDEVPARLSDGEFVFTAKAVKQLGVDKLRKMMEKAEAEYDAQMNAQSSSEFACGGLVSRYPK